MACPSGTATGRSFSHPLRVLVNRAARVRLPSSRFHHLSSQRRSMATREYRSRVRAQRLQQALDYISAFWLSVCCYLICSQEEFKPGYVNYDPLYLVCMSHSLVSAECRTAFFLSCRHLPGAHLTQCYCTSLCRRCGDSHQLNFASLSFVWTFTFAE